MVADLLLNSTTIEGEREREGGEGKYDIYGGRLGFDFFGCMFFMFVD